MSAMFDLKRVKEHPLTEDQAARVFGQLLSGRASEDEIQAFLIALSARKPTTAEFVGAVMALKAQMRGIAAPPMAIDLCGTGGDGLGTLNISTAVSFVVAGAGVPVAKHGNRSMSSKSGAADILEALGVKIDLVPEAAERTLREIGIVFLFAQTHHPAMRHVAKARQAIGKRTIFNLLGPLANPAGVKRQLVGVFAKEWLEPYAEALRALGCERAMVVHGRDGLDELTTTDITYAAILEDGAITQTEIAPEDAGLKRSSLEALKGGGAAENAQALRVLLQGEKSAYRDIVVLNAAAALMVAGRANDIMAGAALAQELLDSGAARDKLDQLVKVSNSA
ncbi:MAG TPA: anthranilate phosphoribosyltransferase [Rhizomicrobium sp.]|jgi:anthranilate phosphoribosyltransferase|nr:anthranilate phosphoribosyltransferase [Rhizomicrobium sp.]